MLVRIDIVALDRRAVSACMHGFLINLRIGVVEMVLLRSGRLIWRKLWRHLMLQEIGDYRALSGDLCTLWYQLEMIDFPV